VDRFGQHESNLMNIRKAEVPNRHASAVLNDMGASEHLSKATESSLRLEASAVEDDRAEWGRFLSSHRVRLRRMAALRLDPRLCARIDPSDVVQEAFLEATERRAEYARQTDPMPPFLWLRFLTLQRLQIVHRRQLGTKSRNPAREVSIHGGTCPAATSAALAKQLLGHDTRASALAIRAEEKRELQAALDRMDAIDREVLVLRHFEQLSNLECAKVMGLNESAATKRYLRALRRLKDILSSGNNSDHKGRA
jgi:RNA polymerase sigma-70 factor (ECF subfamily)